MQLRLNAIYGITFLSGLFIIICTMVKLSALIRFSSEAHMSATFGAIATAIVVQQIPPLLGLEVQPHSGLFQLPRFLFDACRSIPKTNLATLGMSMIALAILFFVKEYVNVRFENKLPAPIPIDIILLVLTTAMSYKWNFQERFNIAVIGTIPSGIPTPTFPLDSEWTQYLTPGILYAILTYLAAPVLFILFATKHHYEISLDQELYAMGSSFMVGSCLSNVALGVSSSRLIIMESCGGRTQISHVFAALTSLVVILLLADYGNALPKCIIAAILVVTFSRASINFKRLRKYWRSDRIFLLIWMVTYVVAMVAKVSDGIIFGFLFSLIIPALKSLFPRMYILQKGVVDKGYYWVDAQAYQKLESSDNCLIITINGPIYFANSDYVRQYICESASKQFGPFSTTASTKEIHLEIDNVDISEKLFNNMVVLNLSAVSYIDTSTLRMLTSLQSTLTSEHQAYLCLASCTDSVRKTLMQYPKIFDILGDNIYPTIEDAMLHGKISSDNI